MVKFENKWWSQLDYGHKHVSWLIAKKNGNSMVKDKESNVSVASDYLKIVRAWI